MSLENGITFTRFTMYGKIRMSVDCLHLIVTRLKLQGKWTGPTQHQYKLTERNGAILNYYPSTGSVTFQGPGEVSVELEREVRAAWVFLTAATPAQTMSPARSATAPLSHDFEGRLGLPPEARSTYRLMLTKRSYEVAARSEF